MTLAGPLRVSLLIFPFMLAACTPIETVSEQGPQLYLFGEVHGTEQTATAVLELVENAQRGHRQVKVLFELSDEAVRAAASSEAPNDAFCSQTGDWRSQDGRATAVVYQLIRSLTQRGVEVAGFADPWFRSERWEEEASDRIRALALSDGVTIVVSGNYHVRRGAGRQSLGDRLSEGHSVRMASQDGGTVWVCVETDCGLRSVVGDTDAACCGMRDTVDPNAGYDRDYWVRAYTPSTPVCAAAP